MHKSFIPEEVKDTNMNEINKMYLLIYYIDFIIF